MSSDSCAVIHRDRRSWSVFLAGALLAVLASAAWAAAAPDPAGRVIRTLGVVEAVAPDGTVRRLRRQDPIFEGDTLRTGARGRAQVRFTDRGLMSLRPDTELAIDDYEYDARAPSTARQQLRLSRGGFRAATGRVADGNRAGYRVSTPLAVIGVRGTLWSARQADGGPLALGVEEGGIEATSSSGRTATLGLGAGYDFARINPDGSVDYFVEPPAELAAGSGIEDGEEEDGGDGGDGGDGDEEGGDFGGGEEAGQAEAPAGAGAESASTALAATTNNPENSGSISQSETGSGSLPTEEPIPGIDFLGALSEDELVALEEGFFFVGAFGFAETGVAGGRTIDPRPDGATQPLTFNAVILEEGLEPSAPGDANFLDLPPDFVIRNVAQPRRFVDGVDIAGSESLSASVWRSDGLFVGPDGEVLGSGIDVFDALSGAPLGLSFDAVHLISGQPTAIANLVGSFSYSDASLLTGSLFTNVAGPDTPLTAIDLFFNVDFTDGRVFDGSMDLFAGGSSPVIGLIFDGSVGGEGAVNGASLDIIEGFFGGNGSLDLERSEMGGFFAGATGQAFAGAFSLYESGGPGAALGTFVAQQGPGVPLLPLTAAERTRLEAGFGYVEATISGGVARTFKGRITDPRSGDASAIVIANGGVPVTDPLFNTVPPNNVILRPDQGVVQFLQEPAEGFGAELAHFELQGFSDGPELPGGPIGVYNSVTGERTAQLTDELLILTGRIADVADLTGRARYSLQSVPQGFVNVENGGFLSLVEPGLQDAATLAFNVDFNTGAIDNGFGQLFTDPEQIGITDPFARDRVDFFFDGTVGLANDNVFADLGVLSGFVVDADGDSGGSGVLDPDTSSLSGFFAGDGSVFNTAFALTSAADENSPANFSAARFIGNAILTRQNLAPTAAELAEFDLGFVFVGAECCGPESSTGAGLAGDLTRFGTTAGTTDADVIFGINTDGMGNDLGALEPGVLANSPEEILRPLESTVFVDPGFPVDPAANLVAVAWLGVAQTSSGVLVDTQTGDITDPLGRSTFFMAARPTPVATLSGEGFQTFSGNNIDQFEGAPGEFFRTLGGFLDSNIRDDGVLPAAVLDPADVFLQQFINAPEADVSFNVDFDGASFGSVTNGSIFAALGGNSSDGTEAGLQLFFDGSINLGPGGSPLVAASVSGGNLGGIPLNMEETSVQLFFIGEGVQNDGFLTAIGAYTGVTLPTADFPEPIAVAGTFSIGSGLLFEERLNTVIDQSTMNGVIIDDAAALNAGRFGIATFGDFSLFGGTEAPAGSNGFLLGRVGRLAADDPLADDIITIGANAWEAPGRDPLTGAALGEVRTERRGFFSQPYDFVLRRGSNPTDEFGRAGELLFDDVRPNLGAGPSYAADGFDVSWGVWQSGGSTDSAVIQENTMMGVSETVLDRELFFASVNPTPTSQLPVVGQFSYTSLSAVGFATDYIGSGAGPLLMTSGSEIGLDYLTASFDLDFSTGDVNNGVLETGYSIGLSQTRWTAGFDGFTSDAVLDLQVNSLQANLVVDTVVSSTVMGDLGRSEIGGILTGPGAERAVLGFNFAAEVVPGTPPFPGDFETVSGIAILDRAAPGTLRPMAPLPPDSSNL